MTTTQEMPVWARILLGIRVTEHNHSQRAQEPSNNSAPAPDPSSDLPSMTGRQYLMLLDQSIGGAQPLRLMPPSEVVQ